MNFPCELQPVKIYRKEGLQFHLNKRSKKYSHIFIYFFKFDFKIITNSQFIFFHVVYVGRFIPSTKGFTLGSQLTVLE